MAVRSRHEVMYGVCVYCTIRGTDLKICVVVPGNVTLYVLKLSPCPPPARARSLDTVSLVYAGVKPEPSWAPGGQAEEEHRRQRAASREGRCPAALYHFFPRFFALRISTSSHTLDTLVFQYTGIEE